jgi:transposase
LYIGEEAHIAKTERRHFTQEFKRNAVNLVMEKGVPVRKVARDLDIHSNLVHQWRRMYMVEGDSAFVGTGKLKPEDAELKRLQKELEEVKEERDILKKSLGRLDQTKPVKYLFIGKHWESYRLTRMCKVIGSLAKRLLCLEEAKTRQTVERE